MTCNYQQKDIAIAIYPTHPLLLWSYDLADHLLLLLVYHWKGLVEPAWLRNRKVTESFMKIGCSEVPKPTYPSLLWPAEWKVPAPFNAKQFCYSWPQPKVNLCFVLWESKCWTIMRRIAMTKSFEIWGRKDCIEIKCIGTRISSRLWVCKRVEYVMLGLYLCL